MADGMTDDDRRDLKTLAMASIASHRERRFARAVLAEAARTDDLAARLDEALTLLADWLDHYSPDWNRAAALRRLVKNAGGGEAEGEFDETVSDALVTGTVRRGGEQVGDILMEALLAHPGVIDPAVSGSLSTGAVRIEFDVRATEAERPAPSGSPAPERYECFDGVTREPTGAVRPPKKGEWFAHSYNDGTAVLSRMDFGFGADRRILRPVQDPAPVENVWTLSGDEMDALVARAREAEADNARLRRQLDDTAKALELIFAGTSDPLLPAQVLGVNGVARHALREVRALLDPPGADQ